MSQLPKNKNLPDVEQIAKVEAYGVFTGQSGKYWIHPGRGQKALTPEELEKFDKIRLRLKKYKTSFSAEDYLSGDFNFSSDNKGEWIKGIRDRFCKEFTNSCKQIFIMFDLLYSDMHYSTSVKENHSLIRRLIDVLQQCDIEFLSAKNDIKYFLEWADSAPAQAPIEDLLFSFSRFANREACIYKLIFEAITLSGEIIRNYHNKNLVDDLEKSSAGAEVIEKVVSALEKKHKKSISKIKPIYTQESLALMIQDIAIELQFPKYQKCSRRNIINWENNYCKRPKWYRDDIRYYSIMAVSDLIRDGMKREIWAKRRKEDWVNSGYNVEQLSEEDVIK